MAATFLLDPSSFRDALARGQGRCVLWLREAGGPGPHRDSLLGAFGRNLAFDPQCEGTRTTYLFDLAEAAGMLGDLRNLALSALAGEGGRWDTDQHAAVALAFACEGEGDEAAASALRQALAAAPAGSERFDSLAWAAVQLDGVGGLLQAARLLGEGSSPDDRTGSGSYLCSVADDVAGAEAVREGLAAAAATEPAVAAFLALVRASEERVEGATSATRGNTLEALLAEAAPYAARGARFLGAISWGRRAPEEEQRKALALLAESHDPWLQALLLRALFHGAASVPTPLLLRLVESGSSPVEEAAMRALASVGSPGARSLLERALAAEPPRWGALRLLASNHRPGDGARVAALLPHPPTGEPDLVHALCLDLLEGFGGNDPLDAVAPMRWLYEHSPCSNCRRDAAAALDAAGALKGSIAEECAWDCNDETRALVCPPGGAPPVVS
jgi:hypothetical protein